MYNLYLHKIVKYIFCFTENLEMKMANLTITMDLQNIEMDLTGIIVKEIMTGEGLADSTILKDLLIIEVVVHMTLIVPQMEVLNIREVGGLLKTLMRVGMALHKIHLT